MQNKFMHKVVMKDLTEKYTLIVWDDQSFPKSSLDCRHILDRLYESTLTALISGTIAQNESAINSTVILVPLSSGWKNVKVIGKEVHFETNKGSHGPLLNNGVCLYGRSLTGLKYIRYIKPIKLK